MGPRQGQYARPKEREGRGSRIKLAGDDPEHVVVVPGGLFTPTAKAGLTAAINGEGVEGDFTCQGGFTAGEADRLRRGMATFKDTGGGSQFRDKLVAGMVANGYAQTFAEKTFAQLEGFGAYGFPESHAASFALLAYASSWMKCRHPDVFLAAILNAQPMGFYAPAQLVRDARRHGVAVRPIDVNTSRWDCTLEPVGAGTRHAVRLGLRLMRGVLFITIEDETGIANIVVWPDLFEKQRRVILSAGMIAVAGRMQREGEVVHVIARTLTDLSSLLCSIGERDQAAPQDGDDRARRDDNPARRQINPQTRDFR